MDHQSFSFSTKTTFFISLLNECYGIRTSPVKPTSCSFFEKPQGLDQREILLSRAANRSGICFQESGSSQGSPSNLSLSCRNQIKDLSSEIWFQQSQGSSSAMAHHRSSRHLQETLQPRSPISSKYYGKLFRVFGALQGQFQSFILCRQFFRDYFDCCDGSPCLTV